MFWCGSWRGVRGGRRSLFHCECESAVLKGTEASRKVRQAVGRRIIDNRDYDKFSLESMGRVVREGWCFNNIGQGGGRGPYLVIGAAIFTNTTRPETWSTSYRKSRGIGREPPPIITKLAKMLRMLWWPLVSFAWCQGLITTSTPLLPRWLVRPYDWLATARLGPSASSVDNHRRPVSMKPPCTMDLMGLKLAIILGRRSV